MAFIQCSLTGTALSWYNRLNDFYKQDWHAFVQAFKKQFSSQKNVYYALVEALSLVKKDNGTVRHFALKVQQLVEKGWCNENASTINLKCIEVFTNGKNTLLHTDFLHDLEIPDILDLVHNLIHEIKSIIFNHNLLLIQSTLKYTYITQHKWLLH